jgi:hypothetical protein
MAGVATVTATGTVGAGNTLTAGVFLNIASFRFNVVTSMLTLVDINDMVTDISIAAATTVTVTLSAAAGNYTVTVS